MVKHFVIGLFIALCLSSFASAAIIDKATDGPLSGSTTYEQDYYTIVNDGLFQANSGNRAWREISCGGNTCMWIPKYSSSTSFSSFSSCEGSKSVMNMSINYLVTDEFSQAMQLASMSNNGTRFSYFVNTVRALNASSHGHGSLTEWCVSIDNDVINKTHVSDTASDADARIIDALFTCSANTNFATAVRDDCYALGSQMVADFYSKNLLNVIVTSSITGQTLTKAPCGGSNVCTSMTNPGFMYSGYYGDNAIALLKACKRTGNSSYCAASNNITLFMLQAAGTSGTGYWTPGNFRTPEGIHHSWTSSSGTPRASCSNNCGTHWDYSDAPRMATVGVWQYQQNRTSTSGMNTNTSTYLTDWASKTDGYTSAAYSVQWWPNGTPVSLNAGYYERGLQGHIAMWANQTLVENIVDDTFTHYDASTKKWDTTGEFGVYRQTFPVRLMGVAIGLDDNTYTAYSSNTTSNGSYPSVGGNINITLRNPSNGSVTTSSSVTLNVSVWNFNTTNGTTTTNGTIPQTLANYTFCTDPAAQGFSLGTGWSWDSTRCLIRYNGTDYQGNLVTPNLSLRGQTNGYNITIVFTSTNISLFKLHYMTSSVSMLNAKYNFESQNSTHQAFKFDGGTYSSTGAYDPRTSNVTIDIFVNVTANTTKACRRGGGCTISEAAGITTLADYIGISSGNTNSGLYHLNISQITVTNIGTAYNVTNTTYGPSEMNVSFYWSNNTLIYNTTGVTNGSSVSYQVTNAPEGQSYWYATARSFNTVANLTGLTFNKSASSVSSGNVTITLISPLNGSSTTSSSVMLNVSLQNNNTLEQMNVTFLTGGSVVLYTQNGVTNGQRVSYNYSGLSVGSYDWYVKVDHHGNTTYLRDLRFSIAAPSTYDEKNVTFRLYDEQNSSLITANSRLEYISANESGNLSSTNGTMYATLTTPESYTLRYWATGYAQREYFVALTGTTNQTIDLYLLYNSSSQDVTVTVYDEIAQPVVGATVKVLKYDLATNSYVTNQIVTTNFEGKSLINVQISTEYYKFIVEYEGQTVFSSDPTYVFGSTVTFRINKGGNDLQPYFSRSSVYGTVEYIESNKVARFSYNDAENAVTEGCINVFSTVNGVQTLVNSTCASYPAAVLSTSVDPPAGQTYTIVGYVTKAGNNQTVGTAVATSLDRLDTGSGKSGLLILVLLLCVLSLVAVWNVQVSVVMAGLAVLLVSIIGITTIPVTVASAVLVMSIILAFVLR